MGGEVEVRHEGHCSCRWIRYTALSAYDEKKNNTETRFYGADGKLTLCKDGYAIVRKTYNEKGEVTEETHFNADGEKTE